MASIDASVGRPSDARDAVPRRPRRERLGRTAHARRRRRAVRARRPRPARRGRAAGGCRSSPRSAAMRARFLARALRRARGLARLDRRRLPDRRVAPAPAVLVLSSRRPVAGTRGARASRSPAGWLVARRRLVRGHAADARGAARRLHRRPRMAGGGRASSSRSSSRSRSCSSCRRCTRGSGSRCGPRFWPRIARLSAAGLLGPLGGLARPGRELGLGAFDTLLYVLGLVTVGYIPLASVAARSRLDGRGGSARRARVRQLRAVCRRGRAATARAAPPRRRPCARGAQGVRRRGSARPRRPRSRPRRAARARARRPTTRGRSCATPGP